MDVEADRSCRNCHTWTTPMWRAGPDGPRSLCNACGLRFRKKRRALQGLDSVGAQKRRKSRSMEQQGSTGRQFKLKEEEEAAILLMALSCGSLST